MKLTHSRFQTAKNCSRRLFLNKLGSGLLGLGFISLIGGCITIEDLNDRIERLPNRNRPQRVPERRRNKMGKPCPRCGYDTTLRRGCTVCNGTGIVPI